MAVQAMKNHAVDFIEKPFEDVAMLELIDRTLALGQTQLQQQGEYDEIMGCWSDLSRRENDVAQLVIKGLANREIADKLSISIKTVEIHRSRVMSKMKVKRLAELMERVAVIKASI